MSITKEMEAFSKIDDWTYGHAINDDWKDINDDMLTLQKMAMSNPNKIYILFGDVPRSDGDNILYIGRQYKDAEDWAEKYANTSYYTIEEFEVY